MKRILFIAFAIAALVGAAQANPQVDGQVSFGFFYSSLSPHGEWIETDPGFYVWRPYHVQARWRPYLHGRWVWSSYGWYWVSYESFGWITYHYGRWYYDDFYGWVWVPDYVWGPAWVEWRYNDDYIGWAPLPPYATFSVSVGIRFSRVWVAPAHYWSFVPCRRFVHRRIVDYVVPVERTRRFFGSTRTSTRYTYDDGRVVNRGIDVGFIERRANTRIDRLEIVETRERGVSRVARHNGREKIEVYRPNREEIEKDASTQIQARRSERRLSIDREIRKNDTDKRRSGDKVDGRETQTRKEYQIYRAPEPERKRDTEIRKERGIRRAPEQDRTRETGVQKERDVRRTPQQERKPEPRIEGKQRDTRTRPESSTRTKERSSTPSRPDRKR